MNNRCALLLTLVMVWSASSTAFAGPGDAAPAEPSAAERARLSDTGPDDTDFVLEVTFGMFVPSRGLSEVSYLDPWSNAPSRMEVLDPGRPSALVQLGAGARHALSDELDLLALVIFEWVAAQQVGDLDDLGSIPFVTVLGGAVEAALRWRPAGADARWHLHGGLAFGVDAVDGKIPAYFPNRQSAFGHLSVSEVRPAAELTIGVGVTSGENREWELTLLLPVRLALDRLDESFSDAISAGLVVRTLRAF